MPALPHGAHFYFTSQSGSMYMLSVLKGRPHLFHNMRYLPSFYTNDKLYYLARGMKL